MAPKLEWTQDKWSQKQNSRLDILFQNMCCSLLYIVKLIIYTVLYKPYLCMAQPDYPQQESKTSGAAEFLGVHIESSVGILLKAGMQNVPDDVSGKKTGLLYLLKFRTNYITGMAQFSKPQKWIIYIYI